MSSALPCAICEAEHTFSALHRIKNYLRSTMTQRGLVRQQFTQTLIISNCVFSTFHDST